MTQIRPMKGVAPTAPLKNFPYLASAKIDGIRCIVKDGVALSNTLKPIPNKQVQRMFAHLEGLDGELVVGPPRMLETDGPGGVFERSSGVLMTKKDIPDEDIRFYVFDRWYTPDVPAISRFNSIYETSKGLYKIHQVIVKDQQELDMYEESCLEAGYEGVMCRQINSPYKYGRTTEREGYLFKLKRFVDAEAVIIGYEEQMMNNNPKKINELGLSKRGSNQSAMTGKDTLGAFLVKDLKTGVQFSVGNGPGLTHAKRDELWSMREDLIGKYITYTYQECGTQIAPRLPQLKGFRDELDIDGLAA
jgi:DNA ligase-1